MDAKNKNVKRNYKDRLFRFLFANEKHKQLTLKLYNAVNDTHYNNPKDIDFELLEDVLYVGIKNDVSFLIHNEINLYEHQSTYNPNMPLRQLFYVSEMYEKFVNRQDLSLFSPKKIDLPTPRFVVFYNGQKKTEEELTLFLSDSYENKNNPELELRVRMININYGTNKKFLNKCKPLKEYSWLIETIRKAIRNGKDLNDAADNAIMMMPMDFEINNIIQNNKKEVQKMIYFDLDDENEKRKYGESWRQLGIEEGFEKGQIKGFEKGQIKGFEQGQIKGFEQGQIQGEIKGFEQWKKTSKELMTAYFINQGYSQEDAQKTVNAVFDGL